jgi:hypothetical protein
MTMGDSNKAESVESKGSGVEKPSINIAGLIRKVLITWFVVWQVFAVTIWLMPAGSGPRRHLIPLVRKYMMSTGCVQGWSMFAPNPTKTDVYIQVRVDYGDGSNREWVFARPSEQGYIERYQSERLRKMIDNIHTDENKRIWPYLARYAAIESDHGMPRTYPMTVSLVRYSRLISPPPYHELPYNPALIYMQTFNASPLRSPTTQ